MAECRTGLGDTGPCLRRLLREGGAIDVEGTPEEAKDLAVRAVKFKKERGRLPSLSAADPWEKRMAEGAAAFVRFKDEGRYA